MERFFCILILVFIFTWASAARATLPHPDCIKWFENSKLSPGAQNCKVDCLTTIVDMGTFLCPNHCEQFCGTNFETSLLDKFIYYPGLTPDETKLIKGNPKDALIVFVQKTRAELSSSKNFPEQKINDEGDAFRHFMWAGLLTKELGEEKSKIYLDAHETNKLQTPEEKAMDLANNRAGILAAMKLIKQSTFSQSRLEQLGLNEMKQGTLSVLNPGLFIPKEPK